MINPIPESANLERSPKIFSSHTVKGLLGLVIKTVVQVGQRYLTNEVVLVVSWNGHVASKIDSGLRNYCENRNVIQSIPTVGITIQHDFAFK